MPCKVSSEYLVRSQCIAAIAAAKEIQTALEAYRVDTAEYPDTLTKLEKHIIKIPQAFNENFSYTLTKNTDKTTDFEIRYIGHI